MSDPKQSQSASDQTDTTAKTQKLPRLSTDPAVQEKEAAFEEGQKRILHMIEDNAPLPEILKSLVLLIEAHSPEMLCSVLLLSADGNHIVHGAAPSL